MIKKRKMITETQEMEETERRKERKSEVKKWRGNKIAPLGSLN